MTQPIADQQRQQARYPVRISCELILQGETLHAKTKNVSNGGAAVRCAQPLSPGDVVTVHLFVTEDGIEAPDGSAFECAASVRWCNEDGNQHIAGLQFSSPSVEQQAVLAGLIARVR